MSRQHKQTLLIHLKLNWEHQKDASQNFDANGKKFLLAQLFVLLSV